MAAWQFEVALEPDGQPPGGSNGSPAGPDGGRLFTREDSDILRKIEGILPRRESWSEDLILWGEEDGNRVNAVMEEGRLAELTARFDLRRPPGSFPAQLVELARYCGARFSTADGRPIPADLHTLSEAVRHSDASRFVVDPHRYFSELAGNPVA
jgi:hypothetical protein